MGSILSYYEEDEAVTAFLRKKGFLCIPGDSMYEVPMKAIFESANFKKIKEAKADPEVVPLGDRGRFCVSSRRYQRR